MRKLAIYGDKDHPIFEQFREKIEKVEFLVTRARYYESLAISLAIIGDHEGARPILKKWLKLKHQNSPRGSASGLLSAAALILEAKSYE